MSRSSGASGGSGTIPNPLLVGNGQAIPWTAEEIIGDNNFVQSFMDLVVSQQNAPDDVGSVLLQLLATDSGGLGFANVEVTATQDSTVGVANTSFTLNDGSGGISFATSNGQISYLVNLGVANNGGQAVLVVTDTTTGAILFQIEGAGALNLLEQAVPAAPAANHALLFTRAAATGNTELCLEFDTGLVVVLCAFDLPRPARYILPTGQAAVGLLAAGGTTLFNTSVAPASLFPANSLKVGDIIRLTAAGELFNNSGGAAVMQVIVRIGGQAWASTTNTSIATGAGSTRQWTIETDYAVQAVGALLVSRFRGREFSTISGAANRLIVLANTDLGDTLTTFDTTVNAALDVLCTSSVSNAATTATLESLAVEYIPGT